LVAGAGPIGLLAAQAARASGAAEVAVTDVNPHRLACAAALGLAAINTSQTALTSADCQPTVLLGCSGSPAALTDAISTLQPAGRLVLVGMGPDAITLPLPVIQDREIVISGVFRYAGTWPAAIALAASGRVQLDPIVTHRFTLGQAEAALTAAWQDARAVKVVIEPRS
jgi:L-iditol 2-dehydrogenase